MNHNVQMILPRKELRISITSKCNMKCVYCHNEGNEKNSELNVDEIRKIIETAAGYGLVSVRLTGGEPLVHPGIEDICRMLAVEYGLKVGVNTNGILVNRLLPLVCAGIVERVIVGIDYYNYIISKQSPIGVPSHTILENVLNVKREGGDICIDVVYQDNYENIVNIVRWGIENSIRVKIIEKVTCDMQTLENPSYDRMMRAVLHQFDMNCVKDTMDESNGYIGDFRAVSFLHSLCRLRMCEICRLYMPLRITASGILKPCIMNSEHDIALNETGLKVGFERILKDYFYQDQRHGSG